MRSLARAHPREGAQSGLPSGVFIRAIGRAFAGLSSPNWRFALLDCDWSGEGRAGAF